MGDGLRVVEINLLGYVTQDDPNSVIASERGVDTEANQAEEVIAYVLPAAESSVPEKALETPVK